MSLSVSEAGREGVACLTLTSSRGQRNQTAVPEGGGGRGLRGAYFFRGACLPLPGFFRACLAMAAPEESQGEVGVFGGSAISGFWFGKGARGPLLASLIFSSSDFMVLRIAFPVFLFSAGGGQRERFILDAPLDLQPYLKTGFEKKGVMGVCPCLFSPMPMTGYQASHLAFPFNRDTGQSFWSSARFSALLSCN